MLPLESLIRSPREVGDLPPAAAGVAETAALASARLESAGGGQAVFAGQASDGDPLTVQVAAVADGVIRVSLSRTGTERPRSEPGLPLVQPVPPYSGSSDTERGGAGARVAAGGLVAVASPAPWSLRFEDATGRELLALQKDDTDVTGAPSSVPFGRSRLPDGTRSYHLSFAARPDEQFYGLGERFGTLGRRGSRTVAWIEDALGVNGPRAYKAVPYFWSTRGYGLMVNSGMACEIDLCHTSHSSISLVMPDDVLEFYVIRAAGPQDAVGPLRLLTGDVPLPPRWALGTWVSASFQPDAQESVLERARKIRRDGFPASTLRGGLSYAFSGATFWSHDVGGFYGPAAPDLYLRWAWFGALSPLIRFHGQTSRLPWDQGPEVYAATRDIVAARYRLLPYLYSSAVEAVRHGRTLLQPMIAAYPRDRGTRDADGQYLLGPDLLVAPVTAADGEQDVYLPGDADWADYGTRAVLTGGRWHQLRRPPGQAPFFVRSGALLPVDPGRPPARRRTRSR